MGYSVNASVGYGIVLTDWLEELLEEVEDIDCKEDLMQDIHETLRAVFKKNKVAYESTYNNEESDFYLSHTKWGGQSDYINARDFGSSIGTSKLPTEKASKQMNTELQNVIKAIAMHYKVANPRLKSNVIVQASFG